MFEKLLSLNNLSQQQRLEAEYLINNFSKKSEDTLERAYDLMYEFLYLNKASALNIIIDNLTKIKFEGDFNLWVLIQPSYTLKFYLTDNKNVKLEIRKMLIEEVISPWHDKTEHLLYLDKVRNGLLVDIAKENLESIDVNSESELDFRTSLLNKYLQILAIGATGKISKKECLNEIQSNLTRLRFLYRELKK